MIATLIAALALAGNDWRNPRVGDTVLLTSVHPEIAAHAHPRCKVVTWIGPGPQQSVTLACDRNPDSISFVIFAPASHTRCLARGWGVGYAVEGWLLLNAEGCTQ
jgi:hypothetical protein